MIMSENIYKHFDTESLIIIKEQLSSEQLRILNQYDVDAIQTQMIVSNIEQKIADISGILKVREVQDSYKQQELFEKQSASQKTKKSTGKK
jgi:hypothetical protein